MPWPNALSYYEAVQNPHLCFEDSELKIGQLELDKFGMPLPRTGTFGSVYRVLYTDTNSNATPKAWAIKCFYSNIPDMQERYHAIAQHLKKAPIPYTVGFDYQPRGIRVDGKPYPILKMEWIQGDLLGTYIQSRLQNPTALSQLAQRWLIMAKQLKQAQIAHGDLQDGNVLVVNGNLKLVDYDGMFVPSLANKPSHELGHPNYQHPGRAASGYFGPNLDHFSLWVIYLSLVALSVDSGIWWKVDGGDKCLILRKEDFEEPSQSKVLKMLDSHRDAGVHDLTSRLRSFLDMNPAEVPPLGEAPLLKPSRPIEQTPPKSPMTITVSAGGRGQYRSIAAALRSAKPGARIEVLPGRYLETAGIVIDKQVEIVGVGAVKDIIVEATDADCILMHADAATVRGLTLRCQAGHKGEDLGISYMALDIPQGRLELQDCDIFSDTSACVAIHGVTANPTIWRCQIHSGEVGLYVFDKGQGTIKDCDIFANARAGIVIGEGGNPTIRQCQIHDGKGEGLWVYEKGRGTLEGCDIFANAGNGIEIWQGGNPTLRRCRIHDGKQAGLWVYDKGQGTIEDCDIFANALSGIAISEGGNLTLRRCRIHDSKQTGLYVYDKGQGTIEDCDIFANAYAGVYICQATGAVIRRCQINRNNFEAVWVSDNSVVTVKNCDLTDNARGAWDIEAECQVNSSRNIPPTPAAILHTLSEFKPEGDWHLAPDIPQKKLSNAKESCTVPSWEEILGLIDCTWFGSATDCILFGREGIYFHRFLSTPESLAYSKFPQCTFEEADLEKVRTGYGTDLAVLRSSVTAERLCVMLQAIRKLMTV